MKKIYPLIILACFFHVSIFAATVTPPELKTRLTEDYPIEMPVLQAYPIYMNATVEAPDTISEVIITIDGTDYETVAGEGFYYYLWTPESYGNHEIVITAKTTDGDENSITRNIVVAATSTSQVVTSLKDVVIQFNGQNSRWYTGTYTFPQFVGAYNGLNAMLEVECPNVTGGCDDWDRWSFIDVKAPDGNWVQLIRYITPYGVACNHELDISDYMSLLQGEVELRIFIDTWGTGGWQYTLDTTYTAGTPEYTYSDVVEIWDNTYDFGNPDNLQPVETFNVEIPQGVEESYMRVSNTGHGWGSNNTSNAAEFFNATHYLDINGTQTFTQNLWNDCNPNPDGCTGQKGTWQYSRAGWCPGAIAPPNIYNMAPYIGDTFDIDYRFHPAYKDLCHPNNPDCVSGQTCPDCEAGENPRYYVDVQIINRSNNPLIYGNTLGTKTVNNTAVYGLTVYPNPSNGIFQIKTKFPEATSRLTFHTIDGRTVKSYYFKSADEMNNYSFDISNLSKGVYFVNLENSYGTGVERIILE